MVKNWLYCLYTSRTSIIWAMVSFEGQNTTVDSPPVWSKIKDPLISVMAATPFYSTMPKKIPQHLAVVTVPTLHQQYLLVINCSTHRVFSLNPDTLSLTTYCWYVMIPFCLVDHRATIHAGLSKGRDVWHRMCCTATVKPTNSSDLAVYAHS